MVRLMVNPNPVPCWKVSYLDESLEYTSLVFRGDTDTCIFHADSDKIPFYLIINRDTSFCGKFDSVIHEIGYHLHNPPLIGFNDYDGEPRSKIRTTSEGIFIESANAISPHISLMSTSSNDNPWFPPRF